MMALEETLEFGCLLSNPTTVLGGFIQRQFDCFSLFTAAQNLTCFLVPASRSQFTLTHILTQNTKCPNGHNGHNLRVLPDFPE